MIQDYGQKRQDIISSLHIHRLNASLKKLKDLAIKCRARDIADKATEIEADYRLMLDYLIKGANDPDRMKMYDKFVIRIYRLLDKLTRRHMTPETGTLYYNVLRFEATRPDDTVANLTDRYIKMIDDSSIFNLVVSDNKPTQYIENLTNREILERRLFNRLWVTYPLADENAAAVEKLLLSDTVAAYMKRLIISSLLLGLLEFFDERRLGILIDTYINESDNSNTDIAPIALTAAIIILFRYSGRPMPDNVLIKMEQAAALPTWIPDMRSIYIELVKTRDTERINRKMTDEVIPELLKLRPDIKKHKIDISQISDISEIEENPEWMDILEKSGITDRLKEMSEIQEEGGDVFMSTFAHLKRFPFFNEIANWFMQFHSGHSVVENADESIKTIAGLLNASPFLCNSDKFSFLFSVAQIPESQRKPMLAQLDNFNINSAEINSAAANPATSSRRNIINKYIQDLYRFFRLYSRKEEFDDPFKMRLNIYNQPVLIKYFNDDKSILTIAEFYFKHKYYAEALEMFRSIELNNPPEASLYQKIGYCYQKGGEIENALEYYQRAELLDARSTWTLKRIAACLSLLGRFSEALNYYRRVTDNDPNDVKAIADTANTLIELRRFDEAIPLLHKVVYLAPDNYRAQRNLARSMMLSGNMKGATSIFQKLIENNPAAADYLYLGHIALSHSDIGKAVEYYKMAAEKSGTPVNNTIERIVNDTPMLESVGIDTSSLPFIIDALDS